MPVLRSIAAAAHITGRHPDLIRRWYLAGHLTAACDITTRTVFVDLVEVALVSRRHQTRARPHQTRKRRNLTTTPS